MRGMFNCDGVHRMLESRIVRVINMVFPFIYAFVDKTTLYTEDWELTNVNSFYFELFVGILMGDIGVIEDLLEK